VLIEDRRQASSIASMNGLHPRVIALVERGFHSEFLPDTSVLRRQSEEFTS